MDAVKKLKLHSLLAAVGTKNGLAPPESQDPIDAQLHELLIADEMRAFSNKRYDIAKKAVLANQNVEQDAEEVSALATKTNSKSVVTSARGQHYQLIVSANAPARSIDATKLCTELLALGVKQALIDKALEKARKVASPAKSFEVVDNG